MLNVGKKFAILVIALFCFGLGGVYAATQPNTPFSNLFITGGQLKIEPKAATLPISGNLGILGTVPISGTITANGALTIAAGTEIKVKKSTETVVLWTDLSLGPGISDEKIIPTHGYTKIRISYGVFGQVPTGTAFRIDWIIRPTSTINEVVYSDVFIDSTGVRDGFMTYYTFDLDVKASYVIIDEGVSMNSYNGATLSAVAFLFDG